MILHLVRDHADAVVQDSLGKHNRITLLRHGLGVAAHLFHGLFAAQANLTLPVDLQDFDHHLVTLFEHVA